MTLKMTRTFATIMLMNLLAGAPAIADDRDAAAATANPADRANTVGMEENIGEAATLIAVEDAIDAVLAANRMELDIRFTDRTSVTIVDGP